MNRWDAQLPSSSPSNSRVKIPLSIAPTPSPSEKRMSGQEAHIGRLSRFSTLLKQLPFPRKPIPALPKKKKKKKNQKLRLFIVAVVNDFHRLAPRQHSTPVALDITHSGFSMSTPPPANNITPCMARPNTAQIPPKPRFH
jgi:hypothetical protein